MSEPISMYQHHKIQAIWHEFFAGNGWKLEFDCFEFNSKSPPVLSTIEIDINNFIEIYKNACVFFSKNEEKICVEVDLGPKNTYFYTLYGSKKNVNIFNDLCRKSNENNIYRGKKIDCDGKFLQLDDITWDDVILSEGVKEVIVANIDEMFALHDEFKKFGLSVKRGVILHGQPGTGKTKICKCLAKDAKYSVLYALPSDFLHPNGIKTVCEMAKDLAPCLLIIEDIDWIAQDRSRGNAPFVMELMNKIDGLESFGDIITLGTTNCLEDLEEAVKNRPGRFDRLINIGLPDKNSIAKMIIAFTRNFVLSQDVPIDTLANCCDNLTGAHIQDLCNTAAINAVKSKSTQGEKLLLKKSHFDDAIIEIKNKNYSSYMQMQSKGHDFGFSTRNKWSVRDFLDGDQSDIL
jgi:SpoVK/Ycf46/Vps4 family AAA+-type ATPase